MAQQTLKEKTAKGLFWGGLSNGANQLLNLTFGIFLARILDSTDYGMVGMLAIFVQIACTLQESGFTVTLANKHEVTDKDYNAVFWFSLCAGMGMYLILFFCAPFIADFYDTPELTPLARFLFLGFLISSSATAHNAFLFKNLLVKQRAIAQIIALIISGTVGVTLAMNGMAYWGIAIQTITYSSVVNAAFWYFSPWRPTLNIDFRPLKGMIGFSSKILATNIFTNINNNVLSVLLGKFYSPSEVGYYSQASKWNTMGYSLIDGMIHAVAQPVLVEVSSESKRQLNVFRKILRFTAFISFPAMFGLALIAHEFILIAVTDKWLFSVPILQLLCIGGAFLPITTLCSKLIISRGKSNIFMWNTIAIGLFQLMVMLLLYPYGIHTMITVYVTINIGWLLIWHYFVHREIRLSLFHALKDVIPYALIAATTMIATHYATLPIENIYLRLIAKMTMAAGLYLFILWSSHSVVFRESVKYLLKK